MRTVTACMWEFRSVQASAFIVLSVPIHLKQWKDRVYLYLDALCKEIRAVAQIMHEKGKKLDTVYIGGGTPTTLEPDQLKILLDEITANFDCEHLAEFTIEAGRPDSITREKLHDDPQLSDYENFCQSADHESGNTGYYRTTSYGGRDETGICSCARVWV